MSSRWATHGQQEAFTRLASMLLLSMQGSVCLYQGEELGLTEAELSFEDLADPYGIEFWPRVQGPRRLPHADGVAVVSRISAASRRRRAPGCRCRRTT